MRLFLCCILSIFIVGCVENGSNFCYVPSPKEKLADEISRKVAMQLKKERNLHPCGFGGGTMDNVRMLAISFDYYKQIEIEEARELLIAAGCLFLKAINEDERIRPYLKNYPFEPQNIEIRIFLQNPNGTEFGGDKLCIASIVNGILKYKIESKENKQLITIYSETFEEAEVKLNTELVLQ